MDCAHRDAQKCMLPGRINERQHDILQGKLLGQIKMGKRRPTPATRSTPPNDESGFAFAVGFSPEKGKPIPHIAREEWQGETERMHGEEREWWAGEQVSAELAVELPFWLMIPDGEITLSIEKTTVTASIHGQYLEVSDGPMSLASRANAVVIGPGDNVWGREFPQSVVPSQMPVFRPMRNGRHVSSQRNCRLLSSLAKQRRDLCRGPIWN